LPGISGVKTWPRLLDTLVHSSRIFHSCPFTILPSPLAAIAVDIARNVTMLGPIIAQRHQQLLAKFGSVGTVWRKLFENPKAQCLLGCLSQFGFGGTGSFDYAQLDIPAGAESGGGAGVESCEPESVGSSGSSGSSVSSVNGGTRGASRSPARIAEAAAAAGLSLPPGFDLSSMSSSDMKSAAATFGISLPDDFNLSSLASFGKGATAVNSALPSASLPPPSSSAAVMAPPLNPALIAAMCGLAPPTSGAINSSDAHVAMPRVPLVFCLILVAVAGKKNTIDRLEQVWRCEPAACLFAATNCDSSSRGCES
jgi:hypothetical protein